MDGQSYLILVIRVSGDGVVGLGPTQNYGREFKANALSLSITGTSQIKVNYIIDYSEHQNPLPFTHKHNLHWALMSDLADICNYNRHICLTLSD